jgi:hypothetical protein
VFHPIVWQEIERKLEGHMKRFKWILATAALAVGLSGALFAQDQGWVRGRDNNNRTVYSQHQSRDDDGARNNGYRNRSYYRDGNEKNYRSQDRDRDGDAYRTRNRDHRDRDYQRRDRDDRGREGR